MAVEKQQIKRKMKKKVEVRRELKTGRLILIEFKKLSTLKMLWHLFKVYICFKVLFVVLFFFFFIIFFIYSWLELLHFVIIVSTYIMMVNSVLHWKWKANWRQLSFCSDNSGSWLSGIYVIKQKRYIFLRKFLTSTR